MGKINRKLFVIKTNPKIAGLQTRKKTMKDYCLPCHWCNLPVTVEWKQREGFYVQCGSCRACGPIDTDVEQAVERWNSMGIEFIIRKFHEAFGHTINNLPTHIPAEEMQMRKRLIDEEGRELFDAFNAGDLEQIAKEAADLVYVVVGACISLGIPFTQVLKEVHRSNMSKLGPDGQPIYREDGKVLKGPNYRPAKINDVFFGAEQRQIKRDVWDEEDRKHGRV